MRKIYLICFMVILNYSLFSTHHELFFNSGSIGLQYNYENNTSSILTLPSMYITENSINTGFIFKPLTFSITDLEHDLFTVYTSANLYWTLIDSNNSLLLGPYINFELTNSLNYSTKAGVLYHHFLPEKYNIFPKMKIRAISVETGYNFTQNVFFASLDLDFLILITLLIGYPSVIFK